LHNNTLVDLNVSNNLIDDNGALAINEILCDPKIGGHRITHWKENPVVSSEVLDLIQRAPQVKRNREYWLDKCNEKLIQGKIHSVKWCKYTIGNAEVLLLNDALEKRMKKPHLQPIISIALSEPSLTCYSLVPFFKLCSKPFATVKKIALKNCKNAGEEDCMDAVGDCLRGSKTLDSFSLTGCCITPEYAAVIASALANNTTLKSLNLNDNEIGDKGFAEIVNALPQTLTTLAAQSNKIGDPSMQLTGFFHLKYLYLSKNHITETGALKFASNLIVHSHNSFEFIDLKENKITSRGGQTLRLFLPKTEMMEIVDY